LPRSSCHEQALRLLALRPHFRRQLEQKLLARSHPSEAIEATLVKLEEQGLLDDRQAAAGFVEAKLRRGPMGRRRMRMELSRRGAPDEVVEEVLDERFAGSELEAVREAAARWPARGRKDAAALARHLDRKGFTSGDILQVVREFRDQHDREGEA